MEEIMLKEVKLYKMLTTSMAKSMFVFTYPKETLAKYPHYFI